MRKRISYRVICIVLVISMLFANFSFAFASNEETDSEDYQTVGIYGLEEKATKEIVLSPEDGNVLIDEDWWNQASIALDEGRYVIEIYDAEGKLNYPQDYEFEIADGNSQKQKLEGKQDVFFEVGQGVRCDIYTKKNPPYTIKVKCVRRGASDVPFLSDFTDEAVDDVAEIQEENGENTELYEKFFTLFVLVMGNILKNLIGIIIGDNNLSIDALVFDRYSKTSLTFFNEDNEYYEKDENVSYANPLLEKNTGVAKGLNKVFGIFQKISATIYVIILVYMGIRVMLISTADRRAKFKALLFDWVKGMAILFLFPYAIRYAILLNHGIVTYIDASKKGALKDISTPSIVATPRKSLAEIENEGDSSGSDDYMQVMYNNAKKSLKLSRAICWFIMLVQMIQFWIIYIKRLIKVTFLIAIFPLVTISYAIDKIGDGKSQAFDNWWKEFLLEVFIQSFHAINYVVVMGLVFEFNRDNWFLAIIGTTYVTKGADIIRALFAQMRGGGAGGPMSFDNAVKAMAKTNVIASGARKLGGLAKGMMKPVNKIAGWAELGLDNLADASYRSSEARLDEARRDNGETSTVQELIQKGSHVTVKRSKEENVDLLKSIEAGLSDEDMKKAIMELAKMSQSDLETALAEMRGGSSPDFRAKIEGLANLGWAATTLTSQRKRASNIDIQQSVDICMKNMTNPNATKLLEDLGLDSKGKLQSIAAQHSVTIDENKRQERLQREATERVPIEAVKGKIQDMIHDESKREQTLANMEEHMGVFLANEKFKGFSEEQITRALQEMRGKEPSTEEKVKDATNAVMNGSLGEYNLEELNSRTEYLDNLLKNGTEDEKKLVEDALKGTNYSFDQFKANLAVQTINYSDTIDGEHRQERIDSAIDTLRAVKDDKKYSGVLSNLETDVKIDELKKGYIPTVTHREYSQEESELRKEFRTLLNDGKIDLGEEFNVYRENYIADANSKGKRDMTLGALRSLFKKNGGNLEQQRKDFDVQIDSYGEAKKRYAEQNEAIYVDEILKKRQAEYDNLHANLKDRVTTKGQFK